MSRPDALPTWIRLFLAAQFALAVLFFALSWSHTVSLAQGRPASWLDLAALALPLVLVVTLGLASRHLWRAGRRELAGYLTIMPWPLALIAYRLLGAV